MGSEFAFCSVSRWVEIIMLEFCVWLADGSQQKAYIYGQQFGFHILEAKAICHLALANKQSQDLSLPSRCKPSNISNTPDSMPIYRWRGLFNDLLFLKDMFSMAFSMM